MRNPPLILVVDDDIDFSEIIATKLKASGFETAVAATAEQGIAEASRLLPDLILMDIQLASGPPGTEVALTIKENQETQNVRIAFLTNFKDPFPGMAGTREEITKELGMEDFLDKTSDLNVLVEKIKGILDRGEAPPAPAEQSSTGEPASETPISSPLPQDAPGATARATDIQGMNSPVEEAQTAVPPTE